MDARDASADVAVDVPAVEAAADASDAADGDIPDALDPCALDAVFSFGYEGGLTAYTEVSALSPAREYTRQRTAPDMMPVTCTTQLPACGASGINVGEVVSALRHPDVVRALRAPTLIVYGIDDRARDGQVFAVRRADGRGFFVGSACGPGDPGCRPVPDGLGNLAGLLFALDRQELARPECAALR